LELDYEIALNIIAYASLGLGVDRWNRQRLRLPSDPVAAFSVLEASLRRAFPDIRDGFTWREAITRARSARPELDWTRLEKDVDAYERYRYGDGEAPPAMGGEFLQLLKAVRRLR
jgi:hypothetical protein